VSSTGRFDVFSHSELIGWSKFEHRDPPMGVAFGRFHPAPAYAKVRAAIRSTFDVSDRVGAQAILGLSVKTPTGHDFNITRCGSIADNSDESRPQDVEIELLGVVEYDRYFPQAPGSDA
jgi:hypothetical protein